MHALARAAEELRRGRNPLDDGGLVALLATDERHIVEPPGRMLIISLKV